MAKSKGMPQPDSIRFICNVCGMRSPEPVLCVRDDCKTETLVCDAASMRKH